MTESAPYFADLTDAPQDGRAVWLTADDGVRIRVGQWGADAPNGTVLMFPGRSEYVEKYGHLAKAMRERGYATVSIDWRGQGLADRLQPNPLLGHVDHFSDYQRDVAAVMAHVRAAGLPEPYYLLAHSMGGAIGLRAIYNGLPVEACAFTAPMWGIQMSPALRPVAWTLSSVSKPLRFSHVFAPGRVPEPYVLQSGFENNTLTSDPEMFRQMQDHLHAQPALGLGGPSLNWLNEALIETRALAARPSPDLACLTFLGSKEAIVDVARIRDRMTRWPGGELIMFEGAQHEVLIETPEVRTAIFDALAKLFVPAPCQSMAG
ncbi:alpha/beta hydrolase [Flavimaricola marinus]|uniref:Phospholipase YtpA n=1 Tax=Flavimaricola marinus TaxID=1819565 RepID=A0A238LGJ7_9RHOB|nr:alpha/beta hydrolase [Flavimaricola marinus]SMY08692.1 Phospholipase YtpA [Flavimaricola marinus]